MIKNKKYYKKYSKIIAKIASLIGIFSPQIKTKILNQSRQ